MVPFRRGISLVPRLQLGNVSLQALPGTHAGDPLAVNCGTRDSSLWRQLEPAQQAFVKQRSVETAKEHAVRRLSRSALVSVLILLTLCLGLLSALPAHSKLVIDFDRPGLSKMPIAVPDFVTDQSGSLSGSELAAILKNDLYLTGLFSIVETSSLPVLTSDGQPDFEACSRSGAQAVVTGRFHVNSGELVFEGRLYDVALKKMELGKRFTARVQEHRHLVHKFGDRVMEALTGVPGCFTSQIIFVGDSPPKEIFAMDFDGRGLRQLTSTGSINMSPEWAPDGRSILFTSYVNRNPDLWSLDLQSMMLRPISGRPGINASARFSPAGDIVALSLSFNGSPNIFTITPQGHIINRLTNGRGNDISPTWSPDGATIAYVSDQAGTPQIYMIPATGGQAETADFRRQLQHGSGLVPQGGPARFYGPCRRTISSMLNQGRWHGFPGAYQQRRESGSCVVA